MSAPRRDRRAAPSEPKPGTGALARDGERDAPDAKPPGGTPRGEEWGPAEPGEERSSSIAGHAREARGKDPQSRGGDPDELCSAGRGGTPRGNALRLRPYRGVGAVLLGAVLVQAVSAAALFALKLGPGAERVREFYLGSEARFTAARTATGLLEVAVPHLVAIPLAILTASHLVGYAGALRRRAFGALATLTFASALLGVACGFGVRYLWPALAWAKVALFCTFEATLLGWCALVAWVFFLAPARVTVTERAAGAVVRAAAATRAGGCPR